jgi:hypothetical protein
VRTFRIIVGVLALINALLNLMRGDWLGCIMFSAMGWSLLLDPNERGTTKLRTRLMLVALVCVVLRFIL